MKGLTYYTDITNETKCCNVIYVTCTAHYPNGNTMKVILRKSEYELSNHIYDLKERYKIKSDDISKLLELFSDDTHQIENENGIE